MQTIRSGRRGAADGILQSWLHSPADSCVVRSRQPWAAASVISTCFRAKTESSVLRCWLRSTCSGYAWLRLWLLLQSPPALVCGAIDAAGAGSATCPWTKGFQGCAPRCRSLPAQSLLRQLLGDVNSSRPMAAAAAVKIVVRPARGFFLPSEV